MCDTCGCNVTPGNEHLVAAGGPLAKTASGNESVEVLKGLLDANDHQAAHNREHFERHGVLAVNLMSSPGSGKTSLLEATIELPPDCDGDGVVDEAAALSGAHSVAVMKSRRGPWDNLGYSLPGMYGFLRLKKIKTVIQLFH